MNAWQDVIDFHKKFGLDYDGPPRTLDKETQEFRENFILEEGDEFFTASSDAHQLDACVDLVYVILGYCRLRGWNFEEAWKRVQQANMAKVLAASSADSKRGYRFDVVKPKDWKAPNLNDLV